MKKILCAVIIICLLVSVLAACSSSGGDDYIGIAKALDEKDYRASLLVDKEDIEDIADAFELKTSDIYCLLGVIPENDKDGNEGYVIFCNDTRAAKNIEDDLHKFIEKNSAFGYSALSEFVRGTIERSGKMVFIGCEDIWDEIK